MVRELRKRHDDRFSRLLLAGEPRKLQRADRRPLLRGRPHASSRSKRGLRVAQVFPGSPAAQAGIEPGDMIVSVDGESIAGESSAEATTKIKGPEGTEVTRRRARRARAARCAQLTLTRAEVALPNVSSRVETVDGAQARLRPRCSASATAPTRSCAGAVRQGRERRGRRDRPRPARQRRRPARGGGADRQHLPARGRGRRLDQVPHPGRHASTRRSAATCRRCRWSS